MNRRDFLLARDLSRSPRSRFSLPRKRQRARASFRRRVRADFPSVLNETYLNSASMHPVGTFAAEAIKNVVDYRLSAPAKGASTSAPRSRKS